MSLAIALWIALQSTPAEAAALRSTAPEYLTLAAAAEHLGNARAAASMYRVDPATLLSIAWHESRYDVRQVTAEPGRRVSCGVMTPAPQRRCSAAELTLLGGYMAGAEHLRVWLDVCDGSETCALTGYAGGYWLIGVCRRDRGDRRCAVTRVFQARAARIRHALREAIR